MSSPDRKINHLNDTRNGCKSQITHRITTLERWGMRVHADFQPESVSCIREAGFTGVLVNGGVGIGPDMITPESLVESPVIPDLMPLTVKGNRREVARRCTLLKEAGLKPWLCLWGVPGPDDSAGAEAAESNRFFDRRGKLEMGAKLARTPELFGHRDPKGLSWRGSRPLCVSHPTVREYYRDLMKRLLSDYPEFEGLFFFPGDNGTEICDHTCPRCRETGLDSWGLTIRYVNELYAALTEVKPDFKFYFAVWNKNKPEDAPIIQRFLDDLDPGIGLCMSLTDNYVDERKSGPMTFNQPWVNWAKPGDSFLRTTARANEQGRDIMIMGEISQYEVWDPVCHNVPNPHKVLEFLKNVEGVGGANAIMDYWGHRAPFISHANHAVMKAYYADPSAEPDKLLRQAAQAHYGIKTIGDELVHKALDCWKQFDAAVDDWALVMWQQRFSFAIGRDGARGYLYRPLIPQMLREFKGSWVFKTIISDSIHADQLSVFNEEDRLAFIQAANAFDSLATNFADSAAVDAAKTASREARNIELAGELIVSEWRYITACQAFEAGDAQRLRTLIEAEIEGRIRQQEVSGRIGWGAGVNPILVDEDIQNMRLYLSRDDFPDTPDDVFHFTATPYTV
jgi:hypothetical protein